MYYSLFHCDQAPQTTDHRRRLSASEGGGEAGPDECRRHSPCSNSSKYAGVLQRVNSELSIYQMIEVVRCMFARYK